MKKRCFNKFLMAWGMAIGLLIPSSVSAQVNWNEKDINGNEWGHLTSETQIFSSSSTDPDDEVKVISLWNVGAKKYLYQGGHWGTEAVLSDNALPMYMLQDGEYIQLPNTYTSWTTAMNVNGVRTRVGFVTNSDDADSQGVFIDNASTGSSREAAQFKFILLDGAKKIYAITSGGASVAKATGLVSGNQYYLSNGTNYLSHSTTTVSSGTTTPSFMWTITQEADGTYTIKDGSYYLYCNNNGALACSTNPTDGYKWSYENGTFSTKITVEGGTTTWQDVTTIATGTEYYITNDGKNFLTYSNGLTNATNMSSASKWVFERAGNNTYYIRLSGSNVYLRRNNYSFTTTTGNNRTAWTWNSSNGTLSNTGYLDTYYISFNSGSWSLPANNTNGQHIVKVPTTTTTEPTPQVRFLVANNTTTSTTAGTSEPLYVMASAMYLDRMGGVEGNGRYNVITRRGYADINALPETAKWKIITRKDFITAFDHTEATNAAPADATFFIGNPGLNRKGGDNWNLSNGSTSGNVTRLGTSLNYRTNGSNVGTPTGGEAGGYLEDDGEQYGAATSNGNPTTNNGSGYHVTQADIDGGYSSRTLNTEVTYNAVYGFAFNGRISGTQGAVSQNVTVSRKGYYIVGVYAYVDNKGDNTTAVLRAEANGGVTHPAAGRHLGIANIHDAEADAQNKTMTQAGILFMNQEEATSKYYLTTMVYIDRTNPNDVNSALEKLRITVSLANGNANTSVENQNGTRVAFDNFRLYYVGDADPILLDELEGSLDYVEPQVFDEVRTKARTLYLKRAMNNNVWNSITLPVNLTAQQVKQAFGNDTRVCSYEKVDDDLKNIIWFKEIDLSNNSTVAIEAGKNYIMFPTNATPATSGSYTTNFSEPVDFESRHITNVKEWTITAESTSPVFTINQVTMTKAPTQNPDPNADIHTTTDRYIMNFRGSYVAGNFVTPNSYIIAGNSKADSYTAGNWYHWVGTSNLAVKGFRCWIGSTTNKNETYIDPIPAEGDNITEGSLGGTVAGDNENPAKLIFMILDNDGETTAINAIQVGKDTYEAVTTSAAYNDNVYSVNGQLVGKGINALNNLAKGIYIMNGKKYVVK